MKLVGLRALVTGASRGIGAAVAEAFAREGAAVVVTASTDAGLGSVTEAIRAAGGDVTAIAADLRDPAQRAALAAAAGPIDLLVNNAGILGPRAALWETSLEAFDEVAQINTLAVFDLLRLIVPGMVERRRGVVINVSSSVGVQGRATWGAYAVSKFGVEGMSQVLAADLDGRGVSCVVINPGGTRTGMRAEAMPDEDPATLPTPEDVVAPFLAAATGALSNGARVNARGFVAPTREDG